MPHIVAAGRKLAYEWFGAARAGRPTLVFLHEGLGSIKQWRDFPAQVAAATGCRALVYDRYGYGDSEMLAEPRVGVRFMHDEALQSLPELLSGLQIADPILVGHSDGASIALIYAGAGHPALGIAALAPHVFVEDLSVRSIEEAKRQFETTDLPERLGKYHRDARKTFYLWNDAWLDPAFRAWNIEEHLPGIRCPVLAIQGEADEYGTMAQVEAIKGKIRARCEVVKLARCGHSPHRDQPEAALAAVARFAWSLEAPSA
ncbi:MAG: alpha/beta fold hydrolase [Burkholderiales bacterium]